MQTTIRAIEGAYQKIDHAIAQALYEHKPVLIQVASNMASLTHPLFEKQPVPFSLSGKMTNEVRSKAAAPPPLPPMCFVKSSAHVMSWVSILLQSAQAFIACLMTSFIAKTLTCGKVVVLVLVLLLIFVICTFAVAAAVAASAAIAGADADAVTVIDAEAD